MTHEDGEDPILGKTIDGCKVVRKLGQGGMGVVYLAEHESLQQEFVLKILNPALTGAEDTVERFFREAQACAQLNHPGIVAIQNVGQEGEYYFIRMEYVEGVTLEDLVKQRNQLEWKEATRIVVEVAEALSHAHQKGMIHRDIKPENIMFTPKEEVKVMDFGLAKHVHSSAKVSVTGQIVGTPFFMSPEQAGGKPTDARSDIYSLGVTLYYLVTGVKPFNGKNLQEIFLKHFFYAPESPKIYNESLPDSLCEVVKRCLKKKKKERYQSAKGLARDLMGVLEDPDAPLGQANSSPNLPVDMGMDEDGGKTVATGGDDLDATVRVEGEDDGGATVKVTDADDGEATVAVGREGKKGEVKTVSFRSASMVFDANADADATIDLDEEDAHAGLDMPTAVLNAMAEGGDGDGSKAGVDSEEEKSKLKKKLLGAALVVLFPLLLVVLLNVKASSDLKALATEFQGFKNEKEVSTADLQSLKDRLLAWKGKNVLAPKDKANRMLGILDERITRQKADDAAAKRRELESAKAKKRIEEKNRQKKQLLEEAELAIAKLQELRDSAMELMRQGDDSSDMWKQYMKVAKEFLSRAKPKRLDYPELEKHLAEVKYPVFVNSEPGRADIYIDGNPTKVKTGESRPVWVRPDVDYTVKVSKRGFNDKELTLTADGPGYPTFELERKEIRTALRLGQLIIRFGPRTTDEPIVPVHAISVGQASGKGVAYFVDRGGFLRALSLRGDGKEIWSKPPQVAEYGDPTPPLFVEPNRIVLVSSLRGTLNAHEPGEGSQLWATPLGSPVTSPPFYKRAWKVIAVGTAAGEVVFLTEEGQIRGRFETQNPVVSAPYFHGDRFCVAGSTDHRVYSIDWRTNRSPVLIDSVDVGAAVLVGPVKARNLLLVGTEHGQVHALTISKKGELARAKVGPFGPEQSSGVSSLAVVGDSIYFTVGRRMYAYDLQGESIWKKPFEAPSDLTPIQADGTHQLIYVTSLDGMVHAIDRKTGDSRWTHKTGLAAKAKPLPPFVVGDELFVPVGSKIQVLAAEE